MGSFNLFAQNCKFFVVFSVASLIYNHSLGIDAEGHIGTVGRREEVGERGE